MATGRAGVSISESTFAGRGTRGILTAHCNSRPFKFLPLRNEHCWTEGPKRRNTGFYGRIVVGSPLLQCLGSQIRLGLRFTPSAVSDTFATWVTVRRTN